MSIPAMVCIVVLAIHLSGLLAVLLVHRRRAGGAGAPLPRVVVLKPLKGLDEAIRENLASFFALDYPEFEIVFGVEDPGDPVIQVVRSLMARHPGVHARLVVGGQDGNVKNPKVRNLLALLAGVRTEYVIVSDSNVRVQPDYLRRTMPAFEDSRVAVVTNLISGVGEESIGAILEHQHLNGYIAMAQSWCSSWLRLTSVIGKSMAVRMSALRDVGGLASLGDYLAEDYLLGNRLARKGYRVVLQGLTVENYNGRIRLSSFLDRHYRWLVMRWRINPASCLLEFFTIPTLWAGLWALLEPSSALLAAGVLAVFILMEQLICLVVRSGRPMPGLSILLKPVKDVLHAVLLVFSLLNDRVNWRGHVLRLGWGTRITRLPPAERRNLPPFLFPMRMGDGWPQEQAPWTPRYPRDRRDAVDLHQA